MAHKLDERGAVALLTTIIISILLAIITTSLVTLMLSELRQQDDAEVSTNAYYAALSGVENAIAKISNGLRSDQACSANLDLNPSQALSAGTPRELTSGWTCQSISFTSNQATGHLSPDKATQLDTGTSNGFRTLTLAWDKTGSSLNVPLNQLRGNAPYANTNPAVMELTVIEYPSSGTFGFTDVHTYNALVQPSSPASGPISYRNLLGNNPVIAACSSAPAYHCSTTFSGFSSGYNYIFRLRSHFTGTDYSLSFFDGAGNPYAVPVGIATIDVTGKVGDAYRRLIYKVPYQNSAASGLDYVIFSDNDVCKNMTVIGGAVTDNCVTYIGP